MDIILNVIVHSLLFRERTKRALCGHKVYAMSTTCMMRCHATIFQRGNSFVQGPNGHLHEKDLRLPLLKKSSAEVLNI